MTPELSINETKILELACRYLAGEATDHTVAIVLPEWMHPSVGNLTAWSLFGELIHAVEIDDEARARRVMRRLVYGNPRHSGDDLTALAAAVGVLAPSSPSSPTVLLEVVK